MTAAVVLLILVFLAVLPHLIPGDPIETTLGPRATEEQMLQVRQEMGIDDPVLVQAGSFVWNALQGDLGRDFATNRPVSAMLAQAVPHTMALAFAALVLAVLLGIPFGVLAATKPDSLLDRITSVISVSFITMPSYVMGLFQIGRASCRERV